MFKLHDLDDMGALSESSGSSNEKITHRNSTAAAEVTVVDHVDDAKLRMVIARLDLKKEKITSDVREAILKTAIQNHRLVLVIHFFMQ